ncbi:MAG: hypothetical protein ABH865_08070 [Candidatus Omnitrophota bacterium]|nr:hypothetical protein [Candidatus Omnitrophota bacterium]
MSNRLIITSGPSCVGKTPLVAALGKFYPDLLACFKKLVIYNSRAPRPKEIDGVDYYFRSLRQLQGLKRKKNFIVIKVRGDTQALDLGALRAILKTHNVLFEGNPFVYEIIKKSGLLNTIPVTSVFIAPLSREEIIFLKNRRGKFFLKELITDIMRRKLLRRTQHQKGALSLPDVRTIETRAASAYREIALAFAYDYILVNHDGEDSDNWEAFYYPLGDARKTLESFAEILKGKNPLGAERWEKSLLSF